MNLKHILLLFICFATCLAAVKCNKFPDEQISLCLAMLKPSKHLLFFLKDVSKYCALYSELRNATNADEILCEYAIKLTSNSSADLNSDTIHEVDQARSANPPQPARPSPIFMWRPKSTPGSELVQLNVYELEKAHPVLQFLKCIYPQPKRLPLFQTSFSFRGYEFFYGPRGVTTIPDGQSSLSVPRVRQLPLAYETVTVDEFREGLATTTDGPTPTEFVAKNYYFLKFDSNNWTNETMLNIYGWPLPDYIEEAVPKFIRSEMGEIFGVFGQSYLYFTEETIETKENVTLS